MRSIEPRRLLRFAGCSRTESQLEETKVFVQGKNKTSKVDVTNLKTFRSGWRRLKKNPRQRPWGLVTAAGVYGPIGPFLDNDWKEWVQGIEINLYGTALTIKLSPKNYF